MSALLLLLFACSDPGPTGRVPVSVARPREANQGIPTLWIRGTVEGARSGQVRFHSEDADGRLAVICLAELIDGQFAAEAPPAGPDVYVSVVAVPDTGPVGEVGTDWGALPTPLPLAGKDHSVHIKIGTEAPWTSRLSVPPERVVSLAETSPQ